MTLTIGAAATARALLEDRLGLEIPVSRAPDLDRGLSEAARHAGLQTIEAYLGWVSTLPEESSEWSRLASHVTIGETYFFRDAGSFDALERDVLPALIEARRTEGNLRLRLWSAGCATGEEPYSLAILLDRLIPDRARWSLTVLATDINGEALARAERGVYRLWSLRDTPAWVRSRYFHQIASDAFELAADIREMVTLAPLNLARDAYPSVMTNTTAMDVILCRNVLMYFTQATQRATTARFRQALVSGGWLLVSAAEASAEALRPLMPVNFRRAIFFRKDAMVSVAHPQALETRSSEPMKLVPGPAKAVAAREPSTAALPDRADLLHRARALADAGALDEALRLCREATARDRLDIDAHLLLGAIAQEQGDIAAALEAVRRAIYLAPDSAAAHFVLGNLLDRTRDHHGARRSMDTVVRLLDSVPPDHIVFATDGVTAGRLRASARAHLERAGGERSHERIRG